jgi:mycothiol synthase
MSTAWSLRPAKAADLPALAALAADSCRTDGIDVQETVEGLQHLLDNPGRLRTSDALTLATASTGDLAGFHKLGAFQQPDGLQVLTHRGYVHPTWRGHGLGGVLVGHAERRLDAYRSASGPSEEEVFSAWYYDGEAGIAELLHSRRYRIHRQMLEMRRPCTVDNLPAVTLPDGVEARPVEDSHLPLIWDAYVTTQADDLGAVAVTAADFAVWAKQPQRDRLLWQVAWHGREVVGLVLLCVRRADDAPSHAYIDHVGVLRSWRRRGVGMALLVGALHDLRAGHHISDVVLDVNAANPTGADHLYGRLGFRVSKYLTIVRKPAHVETGRATRSGASPRSTAIAEGLSASETLL